MKLITKDILHPEFELHYRLEDFELGYFTDLKRYSKKQLLIDIGRAKNYLINERNFQRGDKVLLGTAKWPKFLVWFFAVLELGGSFVVSDSPKLFFKVVQTRLNLYGKIHHLIWSENDYPGFDFLAEYFIHDEVYTNYSFSKKSLNTISAIEDDIVMWSTSSGTTDTPKVSGHSHRFFYNLLNRNAKIFDIKEDDKCLHTKNLHHGSVLGVYLLPNLKFCKRHYWQLIGDPTDSWKEPFVDLIKKYKINRCLLYHIDYIDALYEKVQPEDFNYSININVLSKFSRESVNHLIGKCNHKLFSIFGCTETSGPLFLLEINQKNFNSISYNNFGKPLDDFYTIKIGPDNGLEVTMPDGAVIPTGDKFTVFDGDYYFKGRKSGMRIKGYAIYTQLLADTIERYRDFHFQFGENFDLALDAHNQKIYMRSDFEVDIRDLNIFLQEQFETDAYNLSHIIVAKREDFIYGIKFDSEKFRILCRQSLDLPNP